MAEFKKVVSPVGRASFPAVFEASSFDGGPLKYGLSLIWTPAKFSDADKLKWKAMKALLEEVSMATFGKSWKDLPANFKKGLRSGAEKADLEGYGEGTYFANLTSKMRPGVVDRSGNKVGPEHGNAEIIYAGCYVRATVSAYSYDNKGKGVALGLQNIQFIADGERLDSRTDAGEDFADEDVDDQWLENGPDEEDDNDEI